MRIKRPQRRIIIVRTTTPTVLNVFRSYALTIIPSQPMLLPLQRLLHTHQLLPLNPQILRVNHISPIRLSPIALRRKRLEHNRQLLTKILAPNRLILRLRDLQIRSAATRDIDPGLQVVAVGPLLGVDESILGGRGHFGVGEDGGDEDAGVDVGVAGVVDVGVRAGGVEGDVGAVAAGL